MTLIQSTTIRLALAGTVSLAFVATTSALQLDLPEGFKATLIAGGFILLIFAAGRENRTIERHTPTLRKAASTSAMP